VIDQDLDRANGINRNAWDSNATYSDHRIGEGNDFVEHLIWPATIRLLSVRPRDRILNIGKNPISWNANFREIPPVLIARDRVRDVSRDR
jgi:hypothetical protein